MNTSIFDNKITPAERTEMAIANQNDHIDKIFSEITLKAEINRKTSRLAIIVSVATFIVSLATLIVELLK